MAMEIFRQLVIQGLVLNLVSRLDNLFKGTKEPALLTVG
jgi:hypothetical protein